MNIQWFPGHMAKTRRILAENLKLVDLVIELLDARIPQSSRNPELDSIIKEKPRIVALNKSDLADEKILKEWKEWYNANGYFTIFIDSIKGTGINDLKNRIIAMTKEKTDREKLKGRIFTPVRTMVVGIPNVGKSAFINRMVGKSIAITGDRPGVTKSKQWVRINEKIELMDTPGVLWPKFEDMKVGLSLAFTGAIKDDVMDVVELASLLMEVMKDSYPERIVERYKLKNIEDANGLDLLQMAGKNRGCIISGGEIDLNRISIILLDEFRGGKLGKITLEKPEEIKRVD